ncbi:MAG TPA: Gmad2 immunoglobulin-like domain-containing protein [Pedococcus sp.]|nr:Gmad2 immunoglobulin-like domain-containing protein [Pedococcus sp.]
MSDRTDFLHPDYEPGEFDRVERQLRQALTMEAQRIHPHDRLVNVLRVAHEAGPTSDSTRQRRWLVPVAAAAAVALIAGGAWAATHGDDNQLVPTPPASSGPATTGGPTTPAQSATRTTPTPPPVAGAASLPVYFVGPVAPGKPTYKLFREFLRGGVRPGASPAERAKASLVLAIHAQASGSSDGYLQPWAGQTIGDVTVTSQRISIAVANAGSTGLDPETQRLAVQELVWTAQAAVGQGPIPVHFTIADGSTALFGRFPTSHTYTRPGTTDLGTDLAPLWVTSPARGAVLAASAPVVVQGEAIVFEATVGWQLRRGPTVVRSGTTMASIGAPAQGSYSLNLGRLSRGSYTIRVFETSMADGSVAAEKSVSFTVR